MRGFRHERERRGGGGFVVVAGTFSAEGEYYFVQKEWRGKGGRVAQTPIDDLFGKRIFFLSFPPLSPGFFFAIITTFFRKRDYGELREFTAFFLDLNMSFFGHLHSSRRGKSVFLCRFFWVLRGPFIGCLVVGLGVFTLNTVYMGLLVFFKKKEKKPFARCARPRRSSSIVFSNLSKPLLYRRGKEREGRWEEGGSHGNSPTKKENRKKPPATFPPSRSD